MATIKKIEEEIKPGLTVGFTVVESSVDEHFATFRLSGVWAKGEFRIGTGTFISNLNFGEPNEHQIPTAFELDGEGSKPVDVLSADQLEKILLRMADMLTAFGDRVESNLKKEQGAF